jgi:DNA invertase Pin-like site-specific DNA recombinase
LGSVGSSPVGLVRQSALRSAAGYAGVSTEQQDLTAQRSGLHALAAGDHRIYVDRGLTGTKRTAAFKHAHLLA